MKISLFTNAFCFNLLFISSIFAVLKEFIKHNKASTRRLMFFNACFVLNINYLEKFFYLLEDFFT